MICELDAEDIEHFVLNCCLLEIAKKNKNSRDNERII